MEEIAPGSILQRMYLKHRLKGRNYKTFCEIGGGNGEISSILLKAGLTGKGFDLNNEACKNNAEKNKKFIADKNYSVVHGNIFDQPITEKFDILISSMVIEHLDDTEVQKYFENCKKYLNTNGSIIVFVPSGMKFWGVEDEIAGHFRRYEYDDFKQLAEKHALKIKDLAGLTFPVSNILLSLSNMLVSKNENYKKNLSMQERTVLSGNRNVKYKTSFPSVFKLVLNEIVMYPFYILQNMNRTNPKCMVIYCELGLN